MNQMRIAYAVAEYNADITNVMLERAQAHAELLGAHNGPVRRVPGVYDLPLVVKHLLGKDDVDGVVAIGAVIDGQTDHAELVSSQAARKLMDLAVDSNKPVGLGISGPGQTRAQAQSRIDRVKTAVEAVVKTRIAISQ